MKLLVYSQTSVVQLLEIGNVQAISSHTLLIMWLHVLIHARIEVYLYELKGPQAYLRGSELV